MTFLSKSYFHPPDNLIQTETGIPLPTVGWGPSNCSNCKNATLHHFSLSRETRNWDKEAKLHCSRTKQPTQARTQRNNTNTSFFDLLTLTMAFQKEMTKIPLQQSEIQPDGRKRKAQRWPFARAVWSFAYHPRRFQMICSEEEGLSLSPLSLIGVMESCPNSL